MQCTRNAGPVWGRFPLPDPPIGPYVATLGHRNALCCFAYLYHGSCSARSYGHRTIAAGCDVSLSETRYRKREGEADTDKLGLRWETVTEQGGAQMSFLCDLSLLSGLGELLIALGLAGVVSLFITTERRPILDLSLGALFILMAVGGFALTWRVDKLENADRDLTPAQQVALSKAVSRFPMAKYEVLTSRDNSEAYALALKIAEAVRAGSGTMPLFDDKMLSPGLGVKLIFAAKDVDFRHEVTDTIGRVLIGARIGVISDRAFELPEHTVRFVVGPRH